MVQSYLDLPHKFEFSQIYRYVSNLPAQLVGAYQTVDARVAWHPNRHLEFSLTGQNLLQPHHPEFGGDPGSAGRHPADLLCGIDVEKMKSSGVRRPLRCVAALLAALVWGSSNLHPQTVKPRSMKLRPRISPTSPSSSNGRRLLRAPRLRGMPRRRRRNRSPFAFSGRIRLAPRSIPLWRAKLSVAIRLFRGVWRMREKRRVAAWYLWPKTIANCEKDLAALDKSPSSRSATGPSF